MTLKQKFVMRQCRRIFQPHDARFTFQCPHMVPETRKANAKFCSSRCYGAAKRQTRDRNRRAKKLAGV